MCIISNICICDECILHIYIHIVFIRDTVYVHIACIVFVVYMCILYNCFYKCRNSHTNKLRWDLATYLLAALGGVHICIYVYI